MIPWRGSTFEQGLRRALGLDPTPEGGGAVGDEPSARAPPAPFADVSALGASTTVGGGQQLSAVPPSSTGEMWDEPSAASKAAAPAGKSADAFGAFGGFDEGAFGGDQASGVGQAAASADDDFGGFGASPAAPADAGRQQSASPDFGSDPFGSSDPFASAASAAPAAPADFGSDPFGASDPFASAAPAAPAAPAAATNPSPSFGGLDDDFAGFSSSAAQPPLATGGSLLDLDFLGASTPASSNPPADLVGATMAQLGMADMLASLDSLAVSPAPASNPSATAVSKWLDTLPNYSYLFSDTLSLPA